jgi:hypothetical protein
VWIVNDSAINDFVTTIRASTQAVTVIVSDPDI